MTADTPREPKRVMMLGTFGFQPKATMRGRALGIAQALTRRGWQAAIGTTPWDWPADAGRIWCEDGVRIANTSAVKPYSWPLAVREMRRWTEQQHPTLIHVFKPKGFGDLAGRSLRRRYPIVIDMDDWEGDGGWNDVGLYGPLQRRLFDWQERSWPRQADAVTVASRELERRAIDLGASPERVFYVPNGLTAERFAELDPARAQPAPPGVDPGVSRILVYTRFVEFDPANLASLMANVRAVVPTAKLLIAGASADGVAEAKLRAAAVEQGVSDAIEWSGWIAPAQLGSVARSCALAIHPFDDNRLNRSKCSVKLLELLATGVPVITTSVGENAAMVRHGETGWLAPPGHVEALSTAAIQLLDNPDLQRRLGRAARARVAAHYLWDQLASDIECAYTQALETAALRR